MARTDAELLGSLIEIDPTISPQVFIDTASIMVDECCLGVGYTETRLELIERWLAAHLYALREQVPASENAGDVAVSYQYKVDLHLNQTKYGQQAMLLDTEGGLATLNQRVSKGKPPPASITWLGTPPKRRGAVK